jgi:hypothetical protein
VVGALVACALAVGVLAGASIAPTPASSLAGESSVIARLLTLLATEDSSRPAAAPAAPAPTAAGAAVKPTTRPPAATDTVPRPTAPQEGSPTDNAGSEKSSSGEKKPVRLPPISHVWLVVLGGAGFGAVTSTPTSYPYLTETLLKQGIMLDRYSAIEAYELAGDAALLTGGIGESVSTISQPAGEPAESTDAFLRRAVSPILASSAYGERGLIVITFGSTAEEQGLSLTTFGSTPPAGALLLSPALKAGGHSPETFDSLAPRQSLEAIFAAA